MGKKALKPILCPHCGKDIRPRCKVCNSVHIRAKGLCERHYHRLYQRKRRKAKADQQ